MTNKPLAHMVTIDSTGLQEEAPVRNESSTFEDSPTSLDVRRATPATPLFARVTARLEPASSLSLADAAWIWYPDDDPAWDYNDPSAEGVRYFRRSFDLEAVPDSATLVFTADNLATASINGTEVGTSAEGFEGQPQYSWEHAPVIDVTDALQQGENVLAMEVERFGHFAGLIGRLYLDGDGEGRTIDTDDSWRASQDATEGWRTADFDAAEWPTAAELGDYGMWPWQQGVSIATDPAAVRLALSGGGDESVTEPATAESTGIRTTGWEHVPETFNGGTVTLQTANARVTAATLELAVRNDV